MQFVLPAAITILAWWLGTGIILSLISQPQRTLRWTLPLVTLLLVAGLYAVAWSAGRPTIAGAYAGFGGAMAVWAWVEFSFLSGLVTGPRPAPCPPDATGWRRAGFALAAIFYHECALILAGLAIALLAWDGSNPVAIATFLILWVMRASAKINVFLGVRNLNEEFLPPQLAFIGTYFRRRAMNAAFPASIIIAVVGTALLANGAMTAGADTFVAVAYTLLGTLLLLAVIEHVFMVVPFSGAALWSWGLRQREASIPVEPKLSVISSVNTPSHSASRGRRA